MKESGLSAALIRDANTGNAVSRWFFYCMVLLVVSMPLSEFGMSVSQFLLLGLWACEGYEIERKATLNPLVAGVEALLNNLKRKFRQVAQNRILLVFLSIYLMHVIGLIYTSDFNYALKDLRIKLPLLSLPIIFATSVKLESKKLIILLWWFCLAVIAGSLVSVFVLLTRELTDPREMSIFISHIRFSLLVSLSVFILTAMLFSGIVKQRLNRIITLAAIVWLMFFLLLLKSMTGILVTALTAWLLILVFSFKRKYIGISLLLLTLSGILATGFYLKSVYLDLTVPQKVTVNELDKFSPSGNMYMHDTVNFGIEKGKYVGLYIAEDELRVEWNKRSTFNYDGYDAKGQLLKYTLIRYLHSLDKRKDSTGVNQLKNEDVTRIENGVANAGYIGGLQIRPVFEQLIMGFINYADNNDANGSSMAQRLEYWKTSFYLIKSKPFAGHGTGDVANAFERAYEETHSNLLPEFRHRSHNQFLAIAIAFGLSGAILFLFGIIYPALKSGILRNFLFLSFFIIAILSFLTEDTLETQAGVTFFAFFYALFVFKTDMPFKENAPSPAKSR